MNRELLDRVNAREARLPDGHACSGGRFAIRICVLSFRTHATAMEEALEDIRPPRRSYISLDIVRAARRGICFGERASPTRDAARSLRDPGSARRGRHGRGLPGARHTPRADRRDQGPAGASLRGRAPPRAVRARGADHLAALPPPHLLALRRRPAGRDRLPRHGVLEGRRSPSASRAAALRSEQCLRYGDRDRRRARPRAPAGDRPPRPEARQHHADEVGGQAPRLRPGASSGDAVRASNLSALPTEAARNLTDTGQILGTLQYMSPEQLEGREADARSDLFAFGAVLYEMATGQKAFSGKSQASLIAAILKNEPRADLGGVAADAAGARPRRADLPRQGPRRPLADGPRRQAAAPVDRRGRLAGRDPGSRGRAAPETASGSPGVSRRRSSSRRGFSARRTGARARHRLFRCTSRCCRRKVRPSPSSAKATDRTHRPRSRSLPMAGDSSSARRISIPFACTFAPSTPSRRSLSKGPSRPGSRSGRRTEPRSASFRSRS